MEIPSALWRRRGRRMSAPVDESDVPPLGPGEMWVLADPSDGRDDGHPWGPAWRRAKMVN